MPERKYPGSGWGQGVGLVKGLLRMLAGIACLTAGLVFQACSPLAPDSGAVNTETVIEHSVSRTIEEEVVAAGIRRHFRLFIPACYRERESLPLILNFHGFGTTGAQQENISRMSKLADGECFLVAYPDGRGDLQQWFFETAETAREDVEFVRAILRHLEIRFKADPDHMYAAGFSNGAGMVNRLACEASDQFAAIAMVAGLYPSWPDCTPSRPMPLIAFHGKQDPAAPYSGTPSRSLPVTDWMDGWAGRNACDGDAEITAPSPSVTLHAWTGCMKDADVLLYSIDGIGHIWPGAATAYEGTVPIPDATKIMVEFFLRHSLSAD